VALPPPAAMGSGECLLALKQTHNFWDKASLVRHCPAGRSCVSFRKVRLVSRQHVAQVSCMCTDGHLLLFGRCSAAFLQEGAV